MNSIREFLHHPVRSIFDRPRLRYEQDCETLRHSDQTLVATEVLRRCKQLDVTDKRDPERRLKHETAFLLAHAAAGAFGPFPAFAYFGRTMVAFIEALQQHPDVQRCEATRNAAWNASRWSLEPIPGLTREQLQVASDYYRDVPQAQRGDLNTARQFYAFLDQRYGDPNGHFGQPADAKEFETLIDRVWAGRRALEAEREKEGKLRGLASIIDSCRVYNNEAQLVTWLRLASQNELVEAPVRTMMTEAIERRNLLPLVPWFKKHDVDLTRPDHRAEQSMKRVIDARTAYVRANDIMSVVQQLKAEVERQDAGRPIWA